MMAIAMTYAVSFITIRIHHKTATLEIGELRLAQPIFRGLTMYTLIQVRQITPHNEPEGLNSIYPNIAFATPDIDILYNATTQPMSAATWTSYIHTTEDLSAMDTAIQLDTCKIMV